MKNSQRFLSALVIIFCALNMNAQVTDVFGNKIPAKKKEVVPVPDNYNQTDAKGLKQGPWEKRYTNGAPLYKAIFKDDKPVGEYIRYYPNGKMSLRIIYDESGLNGKAEMFNEAEELTSSGNFVGKNKDGKWIFYSSKDVIASTEEYKNNKPHGETIIYYPGGQIAESYTSVNGMKHGPWLKFFKSGAPMLKANYVNDKLEGSYLYYYESGQLEIEANYKNNLEDGKWTFFHQDGKVNYELKYSKGTLLNPEVLDAIRAAEQADFEKNKGKIKDPEKMQNNPEGYYR
ncbi:toxin-antitoxin system YwqK family antitoxin [Carboxylicivirga caseinilyticus]|uniref:toxin-antitoxin system YwqK family antitoxin n=1 Tax=Carboxylicivirga caseinilyticus TaxID=3417572 RepID=UPI003D3496A2|nr:toxin-antitoxin system YwqK family antitoxin [Marinilabiliaceae bacterium A049]